MRRLAPWALSMLLVSLGCADVDGDLPRPYRRLAVPTELLASTDAQRRGRVTFEQYCALCHGERGDGYGARREGLTRPPRAFTDRGWRRTTSPRRVFFAIREGIRGTAMPAWSWLSEQETWELTAYVLSLGEAP
jgi:mono/diheme cytochrome c family protein